MQPIQKNAEIDVKISDIIVQQEYEEYIKEHQKSNDLTRTNVIKELEEFFLTKEEALALIDVCDSKEKEKEKEKKIEKKENSIFRSIKDYLWN